MKHSRKIRILIAEDNKLLRECLRLILSGEKNFEILGEATNGLQAIDMITDLKPDVILLDINMPELDGIHIIPLIKQKSRRTKVLILTASTDEATILKALKVGAKGYLSKNTSISCLIKAINVLYRNEVWVERKLVAKFLNGISSNDLDLENPQKNIKKDLTPREQDVLSFLIKGHTNKEIAQNLFISEKTVKSHLNKIFKKLDVSRRLEAILCAIKLGFS